MSEETFTAEAKQFHRPNGRQSIETAQLPVRVKVLYDNMRENNCEFHLELIDSMVSCTISNGEEDIDCFLVPNGPKVIEETVGLLERQAWVPLGYEIVLDGEGNIVNTEE